METEDDLGRGNLFATGLVAGGALAGVAVALLTAGSDTMAKALESINLEHALESNIGADMYQLLAVVCFVVMGVILYRTAMQKTVELKE